MSDLATAIAIPADWPALRIPTFPTLERTSTIGFKSTSTVSVLGLNSTAAMLCRDPALPLWIEQYIFRDTVSKWGMMTPCFQDPHEVFAGDDTTILFQNCEELWAYNEFGRRPPTTGPALTVGGAYYLYLPSTVDKFAVQVTHSMDLTGSDVVYDFEFLMPDCSVENISLSSASAAFGSNAFSHLFLRSTNATTAGCIGFRIKGMTINAAVGAYISFVAYGYSSAATVTDKVLTDPDASATLFALWPSSTQNELTVSTTPWNDTRCSASAALFTNVTAALFKDGTVNCARVAASGCNIYTPTTYEASINTVHSMDRYFGPLEKGLYTFTLPDPGSEVYRDTVPNTYTGFFRVYPFNASYQHTTATFRADLVSYANIILFRDIDADASTTLAVQMDRHIEFRNTSSLFKVGFSRIPLESYHSAQMALLRLGVFFENPLHWGLIASMVRKAVSTLGPMALPYVERAVTAVGKKVIDHFGNKNKPTTQQAKKRTPKPKANKNKRR